VRVFSLRPGTHTLAVPAVRPDYYELLGVPRDADLETLRRAFHAAARRLHPDVTDSPEAGRRFRELAHAYSVLSKPGSRLLYDRYGYRGRGSSAFDEALSETRGPTGRGGSVRVDLELQRFEASAGTRKLVQFESATSCTACEGRGTSRSPAPQCELCGGTGRRRHVSDREIGRLLRLEHCPACTGETCRRCGGNGRVRAQRRLRILVPAGVEDGSRLRVAGEGEPPAKGGLRGDLFLNVRVLPGPRDARIVRYAAALLFVAALVSLIAYVFG
jgi:molecular chaperone DnaJ